MTQTTPHALEYAPPSPWHRRRWRRVALVVLALLVTGSIWRWGALVYGRASTLYWQHECATFSQPGDRVVYDEGPDAGLLLNKPGYVRYSKTPGPMGNRYKTLVQQSRRFPPSPPPVILMAPCWKHFSDEVPCWPWADGATLFSHEMVSKTGIHRLVIMQRTPAIEDGFFRLGMDVDQAVFVPGDVWKPPGSLPRSYFWDGGLINHSTPQSLRIYAGQLDPADPSHFTIRYEQWGQTDILDGWLKDDGSGVSIAPRKRPMPPNGVSR